MTSASATDRRGALRECTLEIPTGSVTALVGPNGAGKTTLLHLAGGLSRPTAGSVAVLGHSPQEQPRELLPRIGFVAQEPPLHRGFTISETLELGRRLNPRWDGDAARERIDRVGLPLGQKVGKLSGGQQAQVALTLALAKRPELLLLDEPVAALDPAGSARVPEQRAGSRQRVRRHRRPLLAHRGRPRTGLRSPRDPRGSAHATRRADRR